MMSSKTVLVVEDSDKKFEAIEHALRASGKPCEIVRARTMTEAESLIYEGKWSLVVLDISLDIAPSSRGVRARGQANVGGLGLAQKMFLLEREAPTIIVTAFDSFASPPGLGQSEIIGFEEVARQASHFLGGYLLACLQYNSKDWASSMTSFAGKALI